MSEPVVTILSFKTPRFTPGPWKAGAGSDGRRRIYGGHHEVVCTIGESQPLEIEANAELISAAPDMFELINKLAWSDEPLADLIGEARELLKAIDV